MPESGFKVQVQRRIIQTSQEMAKRGYFVESVHEIYCTRTLNVPTRSHVIPPTAMRTATTVAVTYANHRCRRWHARRYHLLRHHHCYAERHRHRKELHHLMDDWAVRRHPMGE
jgi:hypothetical protein